jgi:hypothetical protein
MSVQWAKVEFLLADIMSTQAYIVFHENPHGKRTQIGKVYTNFAEALFISIYWVGWARHYGDMGSVYGVHTIPMMLWNELSYQQLLKN